MREDKISIKFNFEDLGVWRKAVSFAREVVEIVDKIKTTRKHCRLIEQLESASTSVALNIAEGKGRFSKKEFIQFLYIARGSLYETITLLIIFHENGWIEKRNLEKIKVSGEEIEKMLSTLIRSIRNSIN